MKKQENTELQSYYEEGFPRARTRFHRTQDKGISFPQQGLTHQSFKDECDINNIIKKYTDTGTITHTKQIEQSFGDFSDVEDYHTSLNKVIAAQASFEQLPAHLRDRFSNDPAKLLGFLQDGNNLNEAIKLGLVEDPKLKNNAERTGGEGTLTPETPKNDTKTTV